MEYVAAHYSADLKSLLMGLLLKPPAHLPPHTQHPPPIHTVDDLSTAVSPKVFLETEYLYNYSDMLYSELSREVENGRLFRWDMLLFAGVLLLCF